MTEEQWRCFASALYLLGPCCAGNITTPLLSVRFNQLKRCRLFFFFFFLTFPSCSYHSLFRYSRVLCTVPKKRGEYASRDQYGKAISFPCIFSPFVKLEIGRLGWSRKDCNYVYLLGQQQAACGMCPPPSPPCLPFFLLGGCGKNWNTSCLLSFPFPPNSFENEVYLLTSQPLRSLLASAAVHVMEKGKRRYVLPFADCVAMNHPCNDCWWGGFFFFFSLGQLLAPL